MECKGLMSALEHQTFSLKTKLLFKR